ncbi:unnamed protein product, partial [Prunus brigantina]
IHGRFEYLAHQGVVCLVQDHGALKVLPMSLGVRVPIERCDGWRREPLRSVGGSGRCLQCLECRRLTSSSASNGRSPWFFCQFVPSIFVSKECSSKDSSLSLRFFFSMQNNAE